MCTILVGAVIAIAATPLVLSGIGFTSAEIAAGSWAASMMSVLSVGGMIKAGSIIAVLQTIGATGSILRYPAFTLAIGIAGAFVAAYI